VAHIGIAGAGVLGRLLAWRLGRAGHAVTVFDPAPGPQPPGTGVLNGHTPHAAGFTAAGMLSPLAELDSAGPAIAGLGWRSLALWREIAQALREQGCAAPLFAQHGSLLLAHGPDLGAARRVLARLQATSDLPAPQPLDRDALATLEPALSPGLHAWLLPDEGQVMGRELLQALATHAPGVDWRWGQQVKTVAPGHYCRCAACAASCCGCTRPACGCCAPCGCCTRATASTSCRAPATCSWWAPARSKARTAPRSACAAPWS
jgi:glycine oxidase